LKDLGIKGVRDGVREMSNDLKDELIKKTFKEKKKGLKMEDKLIKEAYKEMKKGLSKTGKCPDQADLSRFAEGIMDEKETESIEEHLVSCSNCCDYMVSLNKVINFPSGERLPEVPDEQLRKVRALVKDKKYSFLENISNNLAPITQSIKEWFTFDWVAQPIPVAVKSGALALLVLLMVSTTFLYYQQRGIMGLQMEIIGKSVIPTRGVPGKEIVEKIIKEGDTLYSNDHCRINFELGQDAYAYVLYYDSRGKLHQLYPDPAVEIPQKVKGNTKYTIPAGENNWFKLDNHLGRETVFVLASHQPISGLKETFNSIQGLSREEALEVFKSKAHVLKVLSFQHQ